MVLMGIFVVGKIDPKLEQRMGQITIKTVHEVPPSRIFHGCSRGVELHPRRGSATRFSTAVQQANPRPGRRTEDGIVRETAQACTNGNGKRRASGNARLN